MDVAVLEDEVGAELGRRDERGGPDSSYSREAERRGVSVRELCLGLSDDE